MSAAATRASQDRRRFEGKVALVTGAAGDLGAEIARLFAKEGAVVVVADMNETAVQQLAGDIGALATPELLDVTVQASWRAVAERATAVHGGIDFLINAAGLMVSKEFDDMTLGEWSRVINVNLTGVFIGCQELLPILSKRNGAIVNFSSGLARKPMAVQTAYGVSKAGIEMLTRCLALHSGEKGLGVRCNCVQPGAIDSKMLRSTTPVGMSEDGFMQVIAGKHPVGRLGTPGDIANAVLYLCSDEASFVTGSIFSVDGGRSI